MMKRKQSIFNLCLAAIGFLVGCVPLAATATPDVLADCFQSATAVAWLDENGDGVWDDGEPPLHGIEFGLEPTVYSRTTSDENGVANGRSHRHSARCANAGTDRYTWAEPA